MIRLKCNDEIVFRTINDLFKQKKLIYSSDSNDNYTTISINLTNQKLCVDISGKSVNFSFPINLNNFLSKVSNQLYDVKMSVGQFYYYPYQRIISSMEKKSLLTDIQNIILSNLLISNNGINKHVLYQLIWSKDKNISLNKLDTHLTNLKNQLKNDLDANVVFQSNDKILRLLIN